MTENDNSNGVFRTFRRIDATVSKWGYSVSGWAGVFVGMLAWFLADQLGEAVALSGAADVLVEPVALLALVYGGLGLAYKYRKRTGGPSCSV